MALAGCSPSSSDGGAGGAQPASTTGSIVFGVTSELRAGVDIDRLRVVLEAGGDTREDAILSTHDATPLAFPLELRLDDLPDKTPASLSLEAFVPGTQSPLVARRASTRAVRGTTLLDRVSLQVSCIPPVVSGGSDGGSPGGDAGDGGLDADVPEASPSSAPPCEASETCVDGLCRTPFVDPQFLEPYTSAWNEDRPDPPCKPVIGATPEVIVGAGQADYSPLGDLEVVQVEKGPQGGHHIWIAVRLKNLHRSGSRTVVSAVSPATGLVVQPFETIFTFDPDEGGYCKLYGLRFQLDAGGVDYTQMLGKELDVTVTITDTSGDVGTGKKRVTLSQSVI